MLLAAAGALFAACGDDGESTEVATLPETVDPPGSEDELAFCLGRLVDPSLDDPGRYDLVTECTGLDREAVEDHPSFVACLSGLARHTPNARVEEHLNRCLTIFRESDEPTGAPQPPESQ